MRQISYLDTNKPEVGYNEFIDREMIHFSKYDNDRSIPNIMDGLKLSLRKILYSVFKRNLTKEIKVAQFLVMCQNILVIIMVKQV